jgi:hypothetical protein
MKCHHKRAIPDEGTSSRGPHSPQGPLLLGVIGTVGWTPPGFGYNVERIRGSHGSEANERLCAGCHVNSYEVTDETGNFLVAATGHRFLPIPCVDTNNAPTEDQTCGYTVEERNFGACTECHGDEDAALSAVLLARNRIDGRVAELDALLEEVRTNFPEAFSNTDTLFTVAEGAAFNQGLGEIQSSAIHNPFLTEALLLASIAAVEDEYGPFPAPPSDASEALRTLVDRWGTW